MSVAGTPKAGKIKSQLQADVFTEDEKRDIRAAVRKKYKDVSTSAEGFFPYPTGRDGAEKLGYDSDMLAKMSDEVLNSFCSVGNAICIEPLAEGDAILDIGCGAGIDLIVARMIVGDKGRVCGVDMTAEMVERARKNFADLHLSDIEVKQIDSEKLPYEDNSFDVVLSNGVINLSPQKLELFSEIRRVLKPGGRLQFADIVLKKELPPEMTANLEAWTQ